MLLSTLPDSVDLNLLKKAFIIYCTRGKSEDKQAVKGQETYMQYDGMRVGISSAITWNLVGKLARNHAVFRTYLHRTRAGISQAITWNPARNRSE
jgi:hypothetical protein